MAEANGIEWQQLKGTGRDGEITEDDVLEALANKMGGGQEKPRDNSSKGILASLFKRRF